MRWLIFRCATALISVLFYQPTSLEVDNCKIGLGELEVCSAFSLCLRRWEFVSIGGERDHAELRADQSTSDLMGIHRNSEKTLHVKIMTHDVFHVRRHVLFRLLIPSGIGTI